MGIELSAEKRLQFLSLLRRSYKSLFGLSVDKDGNDIPEGMYGLFLQLYLRNGDGIDTPVNYVYRYLPYHPHTISKRLKRIIELGYIVVEPSAKDKRVKFLRPTEKLSELIEDDADKFIKEALRIQTGEI